MTPTKTPPTTATRASFASTFLLTIPMLLLRAVVALLLYRWFARDTFGLPELNVWKMAGLFLLAQSLRAHRLSGDTPRSSIALNAVFLLTALLFGFILHLVAG